MYVFIIRPMWYNIFPGLLHRPELLIYVFIVQHVISDKGILQSTTRSRWNRDTCTNACSQNDRYALYHCKVSLTWVYFMPLHAVREKVTSSTTAYYRW